MRLIGLKMLAGTKQLTYRLHETIIDKIAKLLNEENICNYNRCFLRAQKR